MELENDKVNTENFDFDAVEVDMVSERRAPLGISSCLKVDDKYFKKLETEISSYIENVLTDANRQGLLNTLVENERMIRGEFDSSQEKYWEESSEICTTLVGAHTRVIANAISRTIIMKPYFITEGTGDSEKKNILQDFMNNKARYDFKYEEFALQASKILAEQPSVIVNPEWVREVRYDIKSDVYTTIEAFQAKYPDAESCGLSDEQYKRYIGYIKQDIADKNYHECLIEYPNVVTNSPRLNIIHPSDLIMYPFNASRVELAKLIGKKILMTYDDIVRLEKDGVYYSGSAESIKQHYLSSETTENDDIKEIQESGNGVDNNMAMLEDYRSKIYTVVKGHIRLNLEKDGIERDYEFSYSLDERVLLRIARSRNHCSARPYYFISILPNSKSIWGDSIPRLLKNPYDAICAIARQMIDSNTIANVPTFKGSRNDKEWFEQNYQKLSFKPGRIFWLQNFNSFEPMKNNLIDLNASLKIIAYFTQEAELIDGVSKSLVGQPLSDDPEASGVKQAMMIQQSNFMINQYIKNICPVISQILDFVRALYNQELKYDEKVKVERVDFDDNIKTEEYSKSDLALLDPEMKISVRPQKLDDNMPIRLQNIRADMEFLMAIPDINQNPFAKKILIRNYLWMRDNYSINEINMITTPLKDILNTLNSAVADVQNANNLGTQAQELINGVNNQAAAQDEAIISQQGTPGQNVPPQA